MSTYFFVADYGRERTTNCVKFNFTIYGSRELHRRHHQRATFLVIILVCNICDWPNKMKNLQNLSPSKNKTYTVCRATKLKFVIAITLLYMYGTKIVTKSTRQTTLLHGNKYGDLVTV